MTSEKACFGTDGVRGRLGDHHINPEFVLKLGWAVGKVLANGKRKQVLIGKDTRISGYLLEASLEAGLSAAGVDVKLLGPMPTPAIAYLTQTLRMNAGIVISASHNPYYDNGIKFFSIDGRKLPDDVELAIEQQMRQPLVTVDSLALGKAARLNDAPGRYIEFCKSTVPTHTRLQGLKIVLDCANGATYHIAPSVFTELGADVINLCVHPNGLNINAACGSTHPQLLQEKVKAEQADLGIAFDGDGDRVIMVDHKGEVVDGDELLFIIAKRRFDRGHLQGGVVGTQMSNLGLQLALQRLGIEFVRSAVGDRYVLESLLKNGWQFGGEPSGHIICLNKTTTGDGIIAALQVLRAMLDNEKTLHELKQPMEKMPQSMVNVQVADASQWVAHPQVIEAVRAVEMKLNGAGRVLLRPSGTEPVIRIMVEGEDLGMVQQCAAELSETVTHLIT